VAITATLTVIPAAPAHGATVTATYAVSGNTGTPGGSGTISGTVHAGGQDIAVSTTVTLPGTPALLESYDVPTAPGLTFTATADPHVFTAVVP
jgi:hypothetical protein